MKKHRLMGNEIRIILDGKGSCLDSSGHLAVAVHRSLRTRLTFQIGPEIDFRDDEEARGETTNSGHRCCKSFRNSSFGIPLLLFCDGTSDGVFRCNGVVLCPISQSENSESVSVIGRNERARRLDTCPSFRNRIQKGERSIDIPAALQTQLFCTNKYSLYSGSVLNSEGQSIFSVSFDGALRHASLSESCSYFDLRYRDSSTRLKIFNSALFFPI